MVWYEESTLKLENELQNGWIWRKFSNGFIWKNLKLRLEEYRNIFNGRSIPKMD